MYYEVRQLPQSLAQHEIKRCVYLFRRQDAETDVHINEVDGRTVSLRCDASSDVDGAWDALLAAAEACAGEPAESHGDEGRPLFTAPDRRYWGADRLLQHPEISLLRSGQVALTGTVARLRDRLGDLFAALATQESAVAFYAEPYWEAADLEGYGYATESKGLVPFSHLGETQSESGRFWQIAACNQIWRSLEGREIDQPVVYETTGLCCRDEGSNHYLLERLLAFTMREVTFAGSPADAAAFRDRSIAFCEALVAELGLEARLETAGDPFFLAGARDAKADETIPDDTKFELRLKIREGSTLACASFNLHGTFFADRLDYRQPDGTPPWTACTAFGIERWVWAILCQFGPEPGGWPSRLRQLVES